MKKYSIITVILLFVVFVFALSACTDNGDEVDKSGSESPKTSVSEKTSDDSETSVAQYTVYFKSDGEIIYETKVKSGDTTEQPDSPTKSHYFLSGWYKGGEKWDFKARKVVSDITLVVTKEISNFDELKAAVSCEANRTKFGYYRLTENVGYSGWFTSEYADDSKVWTQNLRSNPELGFRGTFDGNGKTVSSWFWRGGLFGVIGNGAVIKNLTINNKEYDGNKGNRDVLFGYSMMGATVDNVTVNILKGGNSTLPDKDKSGGLLTSLGGYGNTLKNVTINAVGLDIDTLFGTGCWFTYPEGYAQNTFENCKISAKSLIGLACTNIANKTVTPYENVSGLKVTLGA